MRHSWYINCEQLSRLEVHLPLPYTQQKAFESTTNTESGAMLTFPILPLLVLGIAYVCTSTSGLEQKDANAG